MLVIPESTIKAQTVDECQSTFSRQHLLITQMVVEPMQFNEAALETIKSIDTVIDIYGQKFCTYIC